MDNLKIESSNVTLVDLVEEKLLKYFKEMKIMPGDPIPKETDLASALGVGRSVLRELDRLDVKSRCKARGDQFLAGLAEMKKKHPIIGDVRGTGLMIAIDLVKDRETKEPASEELLILFEK